jgi:hypothetical protein
MRLSFIRSDHRHRVPSLWCFGLLLCSLAAGQTTNAGNDIQRKTWPHEPEDFKGLKFGMTVEEVRKIMPFGQYACSSLSTGYLCRFASDPFVFWFNFENGKLATVNGDFDPAMFGLLEEAFVSKYGKPQKAENSTIQNRMGAAFDQREITWAGNVFAISLHRYGAKVTEGLLVVESTQAVLRRQKQLEDKTKHILDK